MNCDRYQVWLSGYHDGELGSEETELLETHLKTCADCTKQVQGLRVLSTGMKSAKRYDAPAAGVKLPTRHHSFNFLSFAAGAVTVASIWLPIWFADRAGQTNEFVQNHVAALASGRVVQVVSNDRHNVKPWFAGKVSLAPRVLDLSTQGFTLVGGRVDHLQNLDVPTMEFKHGNHFLSLTVLPQSARLNGEQRGFALRSWQESGLTYVAVSDMDASEMDKFASLYQQGAR